MKHLKFRILLMNISRVVRSIIFINLSNIVLGMNKIFAYIDINALEEIEPSCYVAPYTIKDRVLMFCKENIFVLIVPIVIAILLIIFGIRKIKENRKINAELKRRMEEKNDKQD